jgi:hypothetical protein
MTRATHDARGKPRVQTVNDDPSETVQSDAVHTDIRHIINTYSKTGVLTSLNRAEGVYKDVAEFTDLADAFRQAKVAEEEFMKLPSKVRELFHHSVAEWLDAAHDEDKRATVDAALDIMFPPKEVEGLAVPDVKEADSATEGG